MENKTIRNLLREALGVPENLTNLAINVYNEFLEKIKLELPKNIETHGNWEGLITIRGDFKIADYRFHEIEIDTKIVVNNRTETPTVYNMAFNSSATFEKDNMSYKSSDSRGVIKLKVNMAVNEKNTYSDIINEFQINKERYTSSFGHEFKHAYDNYKKTTQPIQDRTEYGVFSNLRFGIKPIDSFIHNLYYTTKVENLVRTTEVATSMEILGINKMDFIEFLANNETYKSLKEINNFTFDGLKNELFDQIEQIKKTFINSGIDIPNTDEEIINEVLDLTFKNLKGEKIQSLGRTLSGFRNPLAVLFGDGDTSIDRFFENYKEKTEKMKNYQQYFEYEEKMFKFVSDNLIKKIHKLYAMAKDDKKVSALMQKINSKETTNESIMDWDLHYDAEKIPVKKFKKEK
tara:strand:- start:6880 stop:8091 length:1212 start_codon:yes stop_codon:yes gene_type:complete